MGAYRSFNYLELQAFFHSSLKAYTITSRIVPLLHLFRMAESPAIIPPLPPAAEIPSKFIESAKQWWASGEKQSAISEERLLRWDGSYYLSTISAQ